MGFSAGQHWEEETNNDGTPEEVLGYALSPEAEATVQAQEQELEVVSQ